MSDAEERMLIRLLAKHPTPTEVVRKALKADACEIHLTCGTRIIVVRDVNYRGRRRLAKEMEIDA